MVRPATFIDDSPELVDAKKGRTDHHNKGHGNGHRHGRKGDWQTVEGTGYGGEYSYVVAGGKGEPSATWTFEGLEPGKTYQVLVTWVADPANATSTTWTISDGSGGGVLLSISDVDQTELRADATLGGQTWQSLAIVTATSGAIVVRLEAGESGGRLVADAVQLREVAPTIEYHYDGLGRLLSETDALGRTTSYTYDGAGNLTSVTDANGDTVLFAYDAESRLTEVTDPLGNRTVYGYNRRGQITREEVTIDGVVYTRTYQYDGRGNRTREVDRNGRVLVFVYDAANRVTEEIWYDSVADADADQNRVNTIAHTYDEAGRLIVLADNDSSYTYQVRRARPLDRPLC